MSPSENAETLAAGLGQIGMRGSVTDAACIEQLVTMTTEQFGTIDGVVNNTGHLE